MPVRLPVGFGAPGKVMALDDPGKALPFGYTGDINKITFLKQAGIYLVADFNLYGVTHPELPKVFKLPQPLEMPPLRGVEMPGLNSTELNRTVPVFFHRFYPCHRARASFDSGYRLGNPVFSKYLGHTQFPANYSLHVISLKLDVYLNPCRQV
jgi:hypothetical protein